MAISFLQIRFIVGFALVKRRVKSHPNKINCDLRQSGGRGHFVGDGRPMTLRRRLLPGLPLSDVVSVGSYSTYFFL
jgi:hypothetical protein